MDAKQIIKVGSELYEFKRQHEKPVSGNEQLLFDACVALKQLQAENKKLWEIANLALDLHTRDPVIVRAGWGCFGEDAEELLVEKIEALKGNQ